MSVSAIVVSAISRYAEYFGKIVGYLALVEVDCAETFDAWSVDNVSSCWQREHLGERGCVHTCVVSCAYAAHFQPCPWDQEVNDS